MPGMASSSNIALARRYRPRRFADVLVQDHVTAVLRGAIARDRVGHGYLLTGPRGVGKTTAARILAMALNCERRQPNGDPCGECASCERIWGGGANLDVVEIDAASNRGVDDARDLRERAMYAASQPGHHKVYIVDEAHMLTREAWNALLKILEEPPPGVVFVFATTEPQKIAATAAPVLSRLQRLDFRRIGTVAIRARLREVLQAERIEADDDALTLIARHADGGMRDALSVLDQCLSFGEGRITAEQVREILGLVDDEIYGEVLRLAAEHDATAVFPLVERLMQAGADLAEFAGGAAEMLRALLMLQVGSEPDDLTEALRQRLTAYQTTLAPGDVLRMLRLLGESETAIRRSGNARLVVETLLLRWAMMDRLVDLQAALEAAGGASASPPSGSAAPRPARATSASPPTPPPPRRSPAEPDDVETGDPPPSASAALPAEPIALSADALRKAWSDVVAAARSESGFLATALEASSVTEVGGGTVTLAVPDESAGPHRMTLEKQQERLAALLSRLTDRPVKVAFAGAGATPAPERPARLTEGGLRADRLKGLRSRDAALDAVADELDLEIVD
jgi:DNA polymerase-3 subunit gamma/tau